MDGIIHGKAPNNCNTPQGVVNFSTRKWSTFRRESTLGKEGVLV
jgi:hypothetical protein